jgi:hypothetical protein
MDAVWQAIAEADLAARPLVWDLQLLWLTLFLAAVLLLGALVLIWIDRWRKRPGSERLSANEQLTNFRELYEQGQLSQEEFERIRALLSGQLQHELDLPARRPSTDSEPKPETPKPAEPGSPPA